MGLDNALNRFKLLSGMDDSEAQNWLPVIREAMTYVKRLINIDELSSEELSCVEKSAGVYAFYQYAGCKRDREPSFSAGDISVSYNGGDIFTYAKALWETELENLKSLSSDSSFVFQRV